MNPLFLLATDHTLEVSKAVVLYMVWLFEDDDAQDVSIYPVEFDIMTGTY